jgi:hypothetical protein
VCRWSVPLIQGLTPHPVSTVGTKVVSHAPNAVAPSAVCFDCSLAINRQVRNQTFRVMAVSIGVGLVLAVLDIFLSRGVSNGDAGPFVLFYLGFSAYCGRRTVQRVTHRMGGVAVLGRAAATGSGAMGLVGLRLGVLLWLIVGVFSAPCECAWSIYLVVRLGRMNREISQARLAVMTAS